jgi:hypothetical protein
MALSVALGAIWAVTLTPVQLVIGLGSYTVGALVLWTVAGRGR